MNLWLISYTRIPKFLVALPESIHGSLKNEKTDPINLSTESKQSSKKE